LSTWRSNTTQVHPDNLAVEDVTGDTITYGELDRRANCLATTLRSRGVQPGSRVCLLVERSIYMVVGILGVLKAGGAYVPLDGNVVVDKTLNHALTDSGSSLALVQRKFTQRVPSMPTLCLEDAVHGTHVNTHCIRPENTSQPTDSAYIIYTSGMDLNIYTFMLAANNMLAGTTGVPKGVDVMHKNVTNRRYRIIVFGDLIDVFSVVCMAPGNLGMTPGVRVSQLMNISFDMAAWEILGSMSNGATLCLRGKTSKEWRAVMKTVDVVIATPSMLRPHPPEEYPLIKTIAVAGEPCPKSLADSWSKQVAFYNSCGPTEVSSPLDKSNISLIACVLDHHCEHDASSLAQ
jgi:non-ribosomal peptide synthetase component F